MVLLFGFYKGLAECFVSAVQCLKLAYIRKISIKFRNCSLLKLQREKIDFSQGCLSIVVVSVYPACNPSFRAFTPLCVKFSVYFNIRTYFFYFTSPVFQNTHISQSILENISIKYLFFINILLFSLMIILF